MVVLWRLLERLKEYKAELDEVNTRMFFFSPRRRDAVLKITG